MQVALNKNSDPVQNFFLYGWLGRTVPQLKFFQTSEIVRKSRARNWKLILGLQVYIDKAISSRYDVTQ